MESLSQLGSIGLFLASFLAATVLPLSSEIVLSALLLSGYPPYEMVMIATVGNVLGSVVNYALGYWASQAAIKRWLRTTEEQFLNAKKRFMKYGLGALCFAWVPLIGDPITIVAGILRIRILWFLLLVTAGKCGRYIVISYLTLQAA